MIDDEGYEDDGTEPFDDGDDCWKCMGDGGWHDCGDDCCPCLDPSDVESPDWVACDECNGEGRIILGGEGGGA